MYASTSFNSHLVYELLGDSHSRKLLLQNPLDQANPPANSISSHNSTNLLYLGGHNLDANIVMILSVLLCGLICSSGLYCLIRCSNFLFISLGSSTTTNPSPRLANKGIKEKALKTFPIVTYSSELNNIPSLDTECVICLSEFTNDDKVRILSKCNHGFHVPCIDKWLSSHSSCPKCRQYLIETCHKIVGSQATVVPVPEAIIRIEPLEPEGFMRNYREV